jgi:hypothetical protein
MTETAARPGPLRTSGNAAERTHVSAAKPTHTHARPVTCGCDDLGALRMSENAAEHTHARPATYDDLGALT